MVSRACAGPVRPQDCMTPHDTFFSVNPYFLSFPGFWLDAEKSGVFARALPMKTGVWLGAESNRRHVDFQSTALPTELPSRDSRQSCGAVGFSLCNNVVVGQGRVETYGTNMAPVMLSGAL